MPIVLLTEALSDQPPVVTTAETIANKNLQPLVDAAIVALLELITEHTGIPPRGLKLAVIWNGGEVAPPAAPKPQDSSPLGDLSQYVNMNLD